MKTKMAQTSLMAYRSIDKNKLNRNQRTVLEKLKNIGPATNRMLADHLNWPINSVTPRVLELRESGKVIEAYKDKDGQRLASYWDVKSMETVCDVE